MMKLFACLAVAILALSSCGGFASSAPLIVATDQPEAVEYLEYLRSVGDAPGFRIVYDQNADRSTVLGGIAPDLIIGSHIAHRDFRQYLYEIPKFKLRGYLKSRRDGFVLGDIYRDSYAPFSSNGTIRLLPLAFDIPLVYVSSELAESLELAEGIEAKNLLAASTEHTGFRRENYSAMGFSSLRHIRFLDMLIQSLSPSRGGIPDISQLPEILQKLYNYLDNYEQDLEAQFYFNTVFAYSSDHADISQGRLHSVLSSYYRRVIDRSPLADLPYGWLKINGSVQVESPMIYAGILKKSRSKKKALQFFRLLFSSKSQKEFLEYQLRSGMDKPNFLKRLSSNRIVNHEVLPYLGNAEFLRLPRSGDLIFPMAPIPQWVKIRSQVYYPWLESNVITRSMNIESLNSELESFYKLNADYQ